MVQLWDKVVALLRHKASRSIKFTTKITEEFMKTFINQFYSLLFFSIGVNQ